VPTRFDEAEITGTFSVLGEDLGIDVKLDRYSGVLLISKGKPAAWMIFGSCLRAK
jgi:hypothetical protein